MQALGMILGSLIIVVAFNLFLIPHEVLSSGLSGLSMIVGIVTPINTGLANFLLNLPLLIIGYKMLGKSLYLIQFFCCNHFSWSLCCACARNSRGYNSFINLWRGLNRTWSWDCLSMLSINWRV